MLTGISEIYEQMYMCTAWAKKLFIQDSSDMHWCTLSIGEWLRTLASTIEKLGLTQMANTRFSMCECTLGTPDYFLNEKLI